jgi:hypothetical protein
LVRWIVLHRSLVHLCARSERNGRTKKIYFNRPVGNYAKEVMVDYHNPCDGFIRDFWNLDACNQSCFSKNAVDAPKIIVCSFSLDLSLLLSENNV